MSKATLEPRFLELIAREAGCRPGQIALACVGGAVAGLPTVSAAYFLWWP